MSSTIRPDNLKAALDAKVAAAMAQLGELRESEQPRITPHLSPRELVRAFLLYARGIYAVASTLGRAQAGELQFNAWYERWEKALSDADRALWREFRPDHVHHEGGQEAGLIDVEIPVATDSAQNAAPGAQKRIVRFAAHADRAASAVCYDYLRLSRQFASDFVRDHARFVK